jgi:AbrB family looped-hinge helix DNA binding protein
MQTQLSSKGQVIIPSSIRKRHMWHSGTRFTVIEVNDGVLLKPLSDTKKIKAEDLLGIANYKGPTKTLEDMEEAISKGVKHYHDRD